MRGISILAALLFLLPAAATAQGTQGMPLRAPLAAANASRGITVTASATTRVPATSARIILNLTTADRSMTLDEKRVQPLVDALAKSGVDPSSVRLPMNFSAPGGSNAATISATVENPTVAMMQDGIALVGAAVVSTKGLVLNGAQIVLNAAHCEAALDQVRQESIARARTKAESIAKDLGVHIGGPLNVNSMEQATPDGSCTSQYYVNAFMGAESPQTPGDYVSVPVTSSVSITYAIK